ncbi:hypothetical protein [Virgibacillus profundi]|uniref:hypothetical protein n=1 Tax=Virgibacillus profundi TaxID=2024555 RepID=UPI00197CB97A|nr:hypothetical protein [Virgibacillus profundi]
MKFRYLLILFIIFASFFPGKLFATSWAYSFVVWDDYIYVVGNEYVQEVGSEIGEVKKYSDMEQYAGNFSNTYRGGTKYYSIKGISTDEAIAVQENDGKYKKAVREAEYTYGKEKSNFSGLAAAFVIPILIIIVLSIYFIKNKRKL